MRFYSKVLPLQRGYYKRDEINKAAFDSDGFFHTGDSGYIKDGELFLTERIRISLRLQMESTSLLNKLKLYY